MYSANGCVSVADEVGRFQVIDFSHAFRTTDQHHVVHSRCNRGKPGFDRRGPGGRTVLDHGRPGRSEAQTVHHGAGQRRLMVDTGTAHIGHVHMIHVGETGFLEGHHRGIGGDLRQRIFEPRERGDADAGYVDVTHDPPPLAERYAGK